MTRSLLYLIGVPGSGKTTVLAEAIGDRFSELVRVAPGLRVTRYSAGAAALGYARRTFGGTDALPLNAQPHALAWLASCPEGMSVVAEGDRLGNRSFFEAVHALGYTLTVALLDVSPSVATTRRSARGSDQHPTWLLGRATKVARLAPFVSPGWTLPGDAPVTVLAEVLRQHPVIQRIRGGS